MVFWSWKLDTLMLFVLLIIRCSEELNRTRLSLLGLLPTSCLIDQKNLTADVLPAVHLALKHLYKHKWMLKNYELQVSFHDTQIPCHPQEMPWWHWDQRHQHQYNIQLNMLSKTLLIFLQLLLQTLLPLIPPQQDPDVRSQDKTRHLRIRSRGDVGEASGMSNPPAINPPFHNWHFCVPPSSQTDWLPWPNRLKVYLNCAWEVVGSTGKATPGCRLLWVEAKCSS